jgi:exodeoxyribonuclease V gamma subunit
VCIGRPRRSGAPKERLLGPPEQSPVDVLRDLVTVYDTGRREPIPLPVKTSYAWAEARYSRGNAEQQARYKWNTGRYPGENEQPAHEHVWGRFTDVSVLMTPLRPGEEIDGETTRLGAYASRLWLPMLHAEKDPD